MAQTWYDMFNEEINNTDSNNTNTNNTNTNNGGINAEAPVFSAPVTLNTNTNTTDTTNTNTDNNNNNNNNNNTNNYNGGGYFGTPEYRSNSRRRRSFTSAFRSPFTYEYDSNDERRINSKMEKDGKIPLWVDELYHILEEKVKIGNVPYRFSKSIVDLWTFRMHQKHLSQKTMLGLLKYYLENSGYKTDNQKQIIEALQMLLALIKKNKK